jgi:hypothetical protein
MDIPNVGDYVVVVLWNKGMLHTRYVGPSETRARAIVNAVRMDRLEREARHEKGARPRAFLAKIVAEG